MGTKNHRVAGYLPSFVYEKFQQFKLEKQFGDSQAVIQVFSEYFGVAQQVAHSESPDVLERLDKLESSFSSMRSDLLDEVKQAVLVELSSQGVMVAALSNELKPDNPGLVFNTALSDLSSDIESSSLSSPALPGQLNLLPSEAVPKKPDGLRWLSSRQAVEVASKRGCSRNLSGFTKWAARHPDQCLETYGLRRLQAIRGNTTIPAFEDLRYDCQDF